MLAQVHEVMLVIDYFKLQRTSKHDNSTAVPDGVNCQPVDGHVEFRHGCITTSTAARKEIVAHPLLFTHSSCMVEPTTLNVTRSQFGPALTGPVVVGVNEMISIWVQCFIYGSVVRRYC